MEVCELCGKTANTVHAIVEGGVLNVCRDCVRYGNAIEMKKPSQERVEKALKFRGSSWKKPVHKPARSVESETVVSGFGNIVKGARVKMGMKQEDAAKAIAEKTSVLQKVESGSLEPSLKLAKKLEQFFGVKLIREQEKVSEDTVKEFNPKDGAVTIGDLIKFKRG
jgi:putative transcription factor|tara:strand:+ start:3330 stop:3827 length:498 start_codon:yes stop_codon:yes gene_type:complete